MGSTQTLKTNRRQLCAMVGFILAVAINLCQQHVVVGFLLGSTSQNQSHMGNHSKTARMMNDSSLDTGIYSQSLTPTLTRTMISPNPSIIIDNQNQTTPMRNFLDPNSDSNYPKPATTEAPTLEPASKFMDPVAIVDILYQQAFS